jgi:6-pyruvoyltetrahydropterin/6-carboxytetrahydropterin synthase
MTIKLYKEGYFSAAHLLNDYDGKCAQIHGHTWKVAVWVQGGEALIPANGILWDFNEIKKVLNQLDHTNLNTVLAANPTAENIALYIYRFFKQEAPLLAFRIRIYENPVAPLAYCETGDF